MTPHDRTPLDQLALLAVDLETTGLSPARDQVLAVGWVPVDGVRIDLSGCERRVVRRDDPGDAVTIHGLTHDDLEEGRPLEEVLAELRGALAGRVLLAHHAPFELAFLDAAHRSVGEHADLPPAVCTLELQQRLLARQEVHPGDLRLWKARERHGLPTTQAHDALGDALACAELYLAQAAELGAAGAPLTLRDVRRHQPWSERLRAWLRGRRAT